MHAIMGVRYFDMVPRGAAAPTAEETSPTIQAMYITDLKVCILASCGGEHHDGSGGDEKQRISDNYAHSDGQHRAHSREDKG